MIRRQRILNGVLYPSFGSFGIQLIRFIVLHFLSDRLDRFDKPLLYAYYNSMYILPIHTHAHA